MACCEPGAAPTGGSAWRSRPTPAWLSVLESARAFTCLLPASGEVLIGRVQGCDLLLDDPAVSRRHARLVISANEVMLCDEGSHNGTAVNGERVVGSQLLSAGDLISICDARLVFQGPGPREQAPVLVLDPLRLRQRLAQEIDRCRRYGHVASLLSVRLPDAPRDLSPLLRIVSERLRPMALLCRDGSGLLLLPELGPDEAPEAGAAIRGALQAAGVAAQLGLACCPDDGDDADTLCAGARAAARGAGPSSTALPAQETGTVLHIGRHAIILADATMHQAYERIRRCAPTDSGRRLT